MKYGEIIKEKFASECAENFAMCLIRFKGKDYAQFYKIVNPDNQEELRRITNTLRQQMLSTFRKQR